MTKPQFSTEPSMEDILASIRKMISEERLGPRPIPDQIGRSPFGESAAETPAARSPSLETRPDRTPAPAERAAPSFSSLSDALKAATPASEQRRSLEEKIADMLENGAAPAGHAAPPSDSLAVFAANRATRATPTPPDPDVFDAPPRRAAPEPSAPERGSARQVPGAGDAPRALKPASRPPEAPLNGAGPRRDARSDVRPDARSDARSDARPADAGTVVPRASETPAAPREETAPRAGTSPATPRAVGPSPAVEPKKSDTQRIIAMPSRVGAGSGVGQQAGASPAGPALNGANVSTLGLRPVPGGTQGYRPASVLREGDKVADKGSDAVSDGVTGKAGDEVSDEPAKVGSEAPTAREEAASRRPAAHAGLSDAVEPAAPVTANAAGDAAKAAEAPSAESPAMDAAEPASAKPATSNAPSDALVDAVVALVHKEPETLSVFTSGSAFIHGVGSQALDADKPGPNTARKLDRSAAELLRPMLRQWLADNMPRIVEEALRSELISSQSAEKDSEEA